MTTVSFPGFGIGEFSIDPVAIRIPIGQGIEIRWYGILIVTGIILAFLYSYYRSKHEGISFDDLLDITIFTVIFAVIGARAYYVLTSLDQYDTFLEMISIWNGGIAIYGAIIAGAITILVVCKIKKINFLRMFDAAAPGVMIGQIIGRWGNFCNGEAFGETLTQGDFFYFARMGLNSSNTGNVTMFVHPTFLYESLWNLVGFTLIHFFYKKKKFDGQVVLWYVTWYGFGRMLIEGLRTDSLYIGVFRISQVVGFLCFVLGSIALVVFGIRARRKQLDSEEYTLAYKRISRPSSMFEAENLSDIEPKNVDTEAEKIEKEENNGEDN